MRFTLPYRRQWIGAVFSLFFMGFLSHSAVAHDIPTSLTLHAYVHPDDKQLNLLIRIPMNALSELDFPTRGPGYLRFNELEPILVEVANTYIRESVLLYENGEQLESMSVNALRISLPTDRSFISYTAAKNHFSSPALDDSNDLYWAQGMMDAWLTFPIGSDQSNFAIESNLDRLGMQTTTVLRFVLPTGDERLFNYLGNPGVVELDPSFVQAIWRFIVLGFEHILDGMDHLLFLFCLVIPLRKVRALIPIVTSFTIAHSITLISSAFGVVPNVLWFGPFIEMLIALSIVYMAFENIVFSSKDGTDYRKRWLVTFGFGLIHGFGFSFLLAETMQFAGGHLFSSLLAFNLGVEFGQLLVLCIAVPCLIVLFKLVKQEKVVVILLSALVAHTAWHWMMERNEALMQFSLEWPVLDLVFFTGLIRWLMLLVVIAAILWGMFAVFKRFQLISDGNKT